MVISLLFNGPKIFSKVIVLIVLAFLYKIAGKLGKGKKGGMNIAQIIVMIVFVINIVIILRML